MVQSVIVPKKPDIKAFLELHVEQGPVLDVQGLDIGNSDWYRGTDEGVPSLSHGQENHAGTTPMNMRNDALYKASEIVVYVSDMANEMYDGSGGNSWDNLNVSPNAFSVIPGRVDSYSSDQRPLC